MVFKAALESVRARWRWVRGRCPRCSRRFHAPFAYYRTDDPNCAVCKGETAKDLRVWHAFRASGNARPALVVPAA